MPETIVDIFGPVPYKLHLRRKGGLSRDGHIQYMYISSTYSYAVVHYLELRVMEGVVPEGRPVTVEEALRLLEGRLEKYVYYIVGESKGTLILNSSGRCTLGDTKSKTASSRGCNWPPLHYEFVFRTL